MSVREPPTKGSGLAVSAMAAELLLGPTVRNSTANGSWAGSLARVNSIISKERFMRVAGGKTKLMASASTHIIMALNTRVSGNTICSMVQGLRHGLILLNSSVNTKKAGRTE